MATEQDLINAVRVEIADTEPSLPILADEEIVYLLSKYSTLSDVSKIRKASLDAARIALMKLSQAGDNTVGIISIKGSKVAEQYRLALELYLKSPALNPVIAGLGSFVDEAGKTQNPIYAGGISNSDMKANVDNADNNYVPNPIYQKSENRPYTGPFTF